MNSERWRNPVFVTLRSPSSPINSGGWGKEGGLLLHRLQLLCTNKGGVANVRGSAHWLLAKGDEATHSPRSWETKGSGKLLAPLKRTSVILPSRMASRGKGITSAVQEKRVCGVDWRWTQRKGLAVGDPTLRQSNISTHPLCNILPHKTPSRPQHTHVIDIANNLKSRKFQVFSFTVLQFTSFTFTPFQKLKIENLTYWM